MAESAALRLSEKPENYKPPTFEQVKALAVQLRRQREPVLKAIEEKKKARRGEWDEVIRHIPAAYRKMLVPPDLPQLRDMINRVAGLIAKQEPVVEVLPPSADSGAIRKASKEEARLHALRVQIADQQDRDPYAMGIDAQVSWGESWIGVYPDPRRFNHPDYKRGEDEDAETYSKRYEKAMAAAGVPICIEDYDPQTVLPYFSDRERLALCIIESEHMALDIELGMGYKPVRGQDGKIGEWIKPGTTLSEPFVGQDVRMGGSEVVDTTHDRGPGSPSGANIAQAVRKVVFKDPWTYQCYLDGVLVEQWEHNYGVVPMFPALGEQSSDRDPGYKSHGIIDPALATAKQVIMFSAILASNAMQHGFPTPFLKNPQHGLVSPIDGSPLTRQVLLGQMNMLGPAEDITFPYLDAQMMPDFFKYMDYLNGMLESSTLSNFGKAIGGDMAGYAIAQIRSMQLSVLAPIYTNAARQWRKIFYFLRHIIERDFPGGITLPGAIEETEDGAQYRPILKFAKEHTTDFAINVHIDEGIKQDEIAERKSAIEMKDAGIWSPRRAMEHVGVEDPYQEDQEIKMHRLTASPAYDETVLQMAVRLATERFEATRQDMASPFYQAIEQAKQAHMGGGGQFQNQGNNPANAGIDGTPLNQQPHVKPRLEGGPMAGAPAEGISHQGLGIPQTPGGVQQQRVPA